MMHLNETNLKTDDAAPDTAKRRACLKCRDGFESEWAGERICPRCKKSSTWKLGETALHF